MTDIAEEGCLGAIDLSQCLGALPLCLVRLAIGDGLGNTGSN
jgi:hypothetical protein